MSLDRQKAQEFMDDLKSQWVDKKMAFYQYDEALKSWQFEKQWKLEAWFDKWMETAWKWVESVAEHWASLFTPTKLWDTSLKERTEAIAGIWDIVSAPFQWIWEALPEIWEAVSAMIPEGVKKTVWDWHSSLSEEQKKSLDKTWRAAWMLDIFWLSAPATKAAKTAIKTAAKAPVKTVGIAWDVWLWIVWKWSWTSHEAIKEIFNQAVRWWWADILKVIRWDIIPQDILKNLETSFTKVKDDLKLVYWKWYEKLVRNKSDMDTELSFLKEQFLKTLDENKIEVTDKWLDFSESTVRKSSEWLKELSDTYDDILWWNKNPTLEWLDTLKRRLDSWYKWTRDSWLSDKIHTEYSNKIKDVIQKHVPEYKDMLKRYSVIKTQLDEITAELWVWWNAKRTATMQKIFKVFNDNEFIKKEVIDTLEKMSESNLKWQVAWTLFTELLPRWWLWFVWAWMVWTMLMNPSFLATFAALSPRLIWETAVALWQTVWWMKNKVDAVKSFVWKQETIID